MTHAADQRDPQLHDNRVVLSCWPRLLSAKLMAVYLSVAENTVRNHRDDIPGLVHLGRSVRWDRLIVDEWIGDGGNLFRDGS